MKRRIIAMGLISVIMAVSLAACGGGTGGESISAQSDQAQEPDAAIEQSEGNAEQQESEDKQETSQQEESQSGTEATASSEKMTKLLLSTTIEETVLFEDDNIRITAESLEFKYNSPYLNLKFENNSDKALSFVSGSLGYNVNSINGYMVDGMYVNADVEPGKTAMEEAYVSSDYLTLLGIEKIKEIGIGFEITDSDYNEYAKTGPLYISTSDADDAEETDTYLKTIKSDQLRDLYGYKIENIEENDFLEQDEIKGISSGFITNKDGEQSLFLEVENVSDKVLNLSTEDIVVNGVLLASGSWSNDTINPGKIRIMTIGLDDVVKHSGGTKKDFEIASYSTAKMNFHCMDENQNEFFEQEAAFTLTDSKETFMAGKSEVYNANDVKLSFAKILQDEYGAAHILFLIENNSAKEITFDIDYGTLSINGVMADFISYSKTLIPGMKSVLNVELSKYKLDDLNITNLEDISEAEFKLEMRDSNYNEIDNPTIQVTIE